MKICTVGASSNRNRSSTRRSRRILGLTVCILSVLATAEAGFADNTLAKASLSVYGEAACATPICSEAQISVTLEANCTPGPSCTVTPTVQNSQDCGLFSSGFSSLTLYNNPTGTCTGTGTEAPYPVDLLAGPFTLSSAQWQNIFVTDHLIVAQAAGGGTATASANPRKATSEIPTISEWGLVIMAGFLLIAGTVVLRRSRPLHPNARAG